ncbi:MAG: GH3 auxin-responsive promoter family protein [Myxococcota bacterium]|nr:GH3 auxin-responsive promoter family protein [Myxococcota bacterium]
MPDFTPQLGRDGNGPYRLLRGFGDALVQRFLASLQEPRAAQERRLAAILSQSRDTKLATEYGLSSVRTLDAFRAAVPVRTYREMADCFEAVSAGERRVMTHSRVTQLLETSGTTGSPKHLPVTASWAKVVSEAQQLWVMAMVRDHEAASRGKALTLVSPAAHHTSPGGLSIGSNTGRMHLAQPWWVRLRYPVPYAAFCLTDSDARLYTILRFALQSDISTLTTANPSTVLLLCRQLLAWQESLAADLRDGTLRRGPAARLDGRIRRKLERKLKKTTPPTDWRPAKIWPLAVVNCWKGGPARYFVQRLPDALGAPVPIREVGVTASEGYFAIPLGDDWPGGVLWTEGHLLEFIDDAGGVRWAWELEVGAQYRMIISTTAGLYRYDLQDIIEVVGFCENTPVIRFVSKAGRFLNALGEKVSEEQISLAVRDAALSLGVAPVGFTARLIMGDIPRLALAVEGVSDPVAFAAAFDDHLRRHNIEYDSKRGSARLAFPRGEVLPAGTYLRFRQQRVAAGAPEGQVKDPIAAISGAEWSRIEDAAKSG